jgi:hypothetical protein
LNFSALRKASDLDQVVCSVSFKTNATNEIYEDRDKEYLLLTAERKN